MSKSIVTHTLWALFLFFGVNNAFANAISCDGNENLHNFDTLINDNSYNLIPSSDFYFVLPTETNVAPPSQTCRILGRSNSGTSYNGHYSNKFEKNIANTIGTTNHIRHDNRLKAPFPRSADYYVYFLGILKL